MHTASPSSYLVTGGAGFVGGNLVRHLVATTDASVIVLDKLTYAGDPARLEGLDPSRVELVTGDVTDRDLVDDLVGALGPDGVVLHLAAESHNDNALDDPTPFVHTNLVGTFSVLEAVRRHGCRLHHVSTDEVFGDLAVDSTERFTTQSRYAPSSPYSATKAGADHLVRAWVRSFGVRATISSSSNLFGPWQHVEKLVPRQVVLLLDGRAPRLFGDGTHVRDWLHVDDHSAAVLRIVEAGRLGATYLVGAGRERSNRRLVEALLVAAGRPGAEVEHVADRPGHDLRYAVDAGPLRELGWSPRHEDLEADLAQTYAWYRDHERWWRPQLAASEARYAARGQ